MRLLVIASYGVLGGAELALLSFIGERPPGWETSVLVLGEGELSRRLSVAGIRVWRAPSFHSRPSARDLARFSRSLSALLRHDRPDVVWAVGLKAATMAVPACRLQRTPLVWHKVDFSLDRSLAKPLAASVNGVIAVSSSASRALGGPLRRLRLLGVVGPPVALPSDAMPRARLDSQAVGTLGSLLPTKGHHLLVEAASLLINEFPKLRVSIAGAEVASFPNYRRELLALAERLGISERVSLPGFVEPQPFLESLNVYVSASYQQGSYGSEGLSGAMLEASWMGVPVVASRTGGTPEGVIDGITGVLVEPGDAAALAAGIRTLLSDPARAGRMGEAGARFARERFVPATVAAQLFSHLERAAGERRRAAPSDWAR
jgi:glycosyltransferase involved in cell wall biosynthesis